MESQSLPVGLTYGDPRVIPLSEKRLESYPYKHMKPIADTTYGRQYAKSGKDWDETNDAEWEEYVQTGASVANIEKLADHFMVRPKWANVMAQIQKCDVPPIVPSGPLMDLTINMVTDYLTYMESGFGFCENWKFDLSTSGGFPWNKRKVKTKGDIKENHNEELLEYTHNLDYEIIDCYNDKIELLSMADFDRKKVRGVFGSSYQGNMRERLAFGGQNELLHAGSSDSWIKYGFVKQYGGFNTLIQQLEPYDTIVESDTSGWDRTVFLEPVYEVRKRLLTNYQEYSIFIDRVAADNISPKVLLPNGYIVQRVTGNDSGKNNTTTDNCIAHLIILFYLFNKRQYEMGMQPSISYILDNAKFFIYSDDKIGGFYMDKWFDSIEHFKEFESSVYAEFGMVLKQSAIMVTRKDPGQRIDPGHSFLGSFCHYDEDNHMYLPYPRLGKICSSFCRKYAMKDVVIRFVRLIDLTVNTFPNPEIYAEAIAYLQWFYNKHKKHRAIFNELLNDLDVKLKVASTFSRIYTGFEGIRSRLIF